MEPDEKTLILGMGNVLLNDEGIGVEVVRALNEVNLPENIDLLDGGTGGFTLLSLFHIYKNMIIIDAALTDDSPGTIRVIEPKFATDFPKSLSTHELGLKDMIESAILLDKMPKIYLIIVTINPQQDMEMTVTPEIKSKIPEVISEIKSILKNQLHID